MMTLGRGQQVLEIIIQFFCSSRRRHTSSLRDWSSDVCSSDLLDVLEPGFVEDPGMAAASSTGSSTKPGSSTSSPSAVCQLRTIWGTPSAGGTGSTSTAPGKIGRAAGRERGEATGGRVAVRDKA